MSASRPLSLGPSQTTSIDALIHMVPALSLAPGASIESAAVSAAMYEASRSALMASEKREQPTCKALVLFNQTIIARLTLFRTYRFCHRCLVQPDLMAENRWLPKSWLHLYCASHPLWPVYGASPGTRSKRDISLSFTLHVGSFENAIA